MKNKQEQIEEMAKERNEIKDIMKLLDKCVSLNPMCKAEVATVIYGNSYRKAGDVIDEFVERLEKYIESRNDLWDEDRPEFDEEFVKFGIQIVADEMRQEVDK